MSALAVRERYECSAYGPHTIRNQLLRRTSSIALARMSTLTSGAKLCTYAVAADTRLENNEMAVDQVFAASERAVGLDTHQGWASERKPQ